MDRIKKYIFNKNKKKSDYLTKIGYNKWVF